MMVVRLDAEVTKASLGNTRAVGTQRGIARLAIPGILLAIICLVPFLNKAFTIDDPWFLLEAKQILKTPLQPMSFPICWMGNETCIAKASSLGPGAAQALMGYLLVPTVLGGGAEWTAHLLQLVLICVAVLEMVRLALRLGFDRFQSAAAGLLMVATPPFLSMASTAMPDVAALTLGLTGMERLLAWREDRRWQQGFTAALMLGLAPFARPHLAFLIPIGALWLFKRLGVDKAVRQLRRDVYLWAPVVLGACILCLLLLVTRDRGPKVEVADAMFGLWIIPFNLYAYLIYLSFPLPFAAVWFARHWRKTLPLLLLPVVPLLAVHFAMFRSRDLWQDWPTLAAVCGLVGLLHMFHRAFRRGDRLGLLLGLWLLIPVPAIVFAHLPIKYMVAVLPAVVLIVIRHLASLPRPRGLAGGWAIVVCGAAYSLLLLRADADFAECGRRAAAELITPHVAAGEKVWFGGEWGFYWYAQQAGASLSKPGEVGPKPGELLAVGLMEGGDVTRDRFPKRELIASRHYDAPHGRTVGFGGALYTNRAGNSLWVWNPGKTNDYELWRVH